MKKVEELLQLTPREIATLQNLMQSDSIKSSEKRHFIDVVKKWIKENEEIRLQDEVYSHFEWNEVNLVVKDFREIEHHPDLYACTVEINEYPLEVGFYYRDEKLDDYFIDHVTNDICPHCEKYNVAKQHCERFENYAQAKRLIEKIRIIKGF
jgi:hypothetical protein